MARLFAALPVDAAAADALAPARALLEPFSSIITTVAPQIYHITLKFFGECDGARARAIEAAFDRISPPGALAYALCGLGAFPSSRNASAIWCGIRADLGPMRRLAGEIEDLAERLGFPREGRPFEPHLTLARVRRGRRPPTALAACIDGNARTLFGESSFDRVALFSSRLRPEGPEYTPLRVITLPAP